jgi:Zn-dependent M28 family amino/carboxypeptidase
MSGELKARLHQHLQQIARERDPYIAPGGHFFVQQYIQQELAQWGTVEAHEFQQGSKTHQNLILNLPATSNSQQQNPILIGAHYDAVPGTPGADDNATGVAALLELARMFALEPLKYPVRIVAFDMEEYGLVGSSSYAAELRSQKQQLRLMISLEMLGYCDPTPGSQSYPKPLDLFYPNRGDFIALIGNLSTTVDTIRLSRKMRQSGTPCQWLPVPNRGLIVPQTRWSDHSPFWDRGYRAMMVTDTAFLRNPHYHQPSDRIDTLNLDFFTGVCRSLAQGIRSL